MQKNFYYLLFLFFFSYSFSQNSEIKETGGAVLASPFNYCNSSLLNLEVADYASTSVTTSNTVNVSDYNSIIVDTSNEQDVQFNASVTATDKFSYPIDLGFSFKFFNVNYSKMVVGSNGRLLFTNDPIINDLHDTTTFVDRVFPSVTLPSTDYHKIYKNGDVTREIKMAQIFAAFTKLRVNSSTGGYKYIKFEYDEDNNPQTRDIKGILITFQSVIPHNGVGGDLGSFFTSRVILFDDGRVVLNVQNKSGGSYNAILGMQNENGDDYVIPGPSSNNNGIWNSVSGSAYVVTTGSILTPTYLWELDRNNDGTIEQTSNTRFFSNYTPISDVEKLSVKISFLETTEIKRSEVIFKEIKTPIIEGTLSCVYDMRVNDASYDSNLTYTWYRVGETSPVGSGRNLSLHRQGSTVGDYYVKITKADGSAICQGSDESNRLRFEKQRFPGLVVNSKCLTDNSPTPSAFKTISLYDTFYPKYDPTSGLEPYQIAFYTNSGVVSDADAANFEVPANTELNLQFAVKDSAGIYSCHTGALSLYYLSMPPKKTISLCSSVTTYDLQSVFQDPTYPLVYSYYYTYADDGSVADGSAIDVSRKVNVKTTVSGSFTCFTNTEVDFILGDTVALPNVSMQERCKGSDNNANRFDFNLIKTTLDPTNQYDIKFYRKDNDQEIIPIADAPNTVPNLNLAGYFWSSRSGDFLVYAKVIDRADPSCFSVSNDIVLRVYSKPAVRVSNPISLKNCAGNTVFNLTQNADQLTDAAPPVTVTLEYYSPNGALLTPSQITNYDASIYGANPYIKVIYNTTCSDIINFNLVYNPKPVANQSDILICSETTYSLQDFKIKAIGNPSNYTFTDLSGNPLPASFDLTLLPQTINFLLKDNITGCTSDPQAINFVQGANSPLLTTFADITECDSDFDGKTEFNLDDVKNDFTTPDATFEYFKDAGLTQSISSNYTNETAFAQTVYVRITIPGFCPTVAKINLKVNTPTKSSKLDDKYFICYQNTVSSTTSYLPVKIDAGTENDYFLWSDGQTSQVATFDRPGNYSVTYKKGINGCPYTHTFTISDENQPKIQVINQTNTSIEVIANGGEKPYRYYFNGVPQTSNILQNPTASSYDIQVESATGCFGPPQTVYFIKINNAFTPNGDGINDVWKIENIDQMERVSIQIVDRNGAKVFESTTPDKSEWDGKMNGRALPTSTYWYVVSWYDAVTQKTEQRQGWILLKNRD